MIVIGSGFAQEYCEITGGDVNNLPETGGKTIQSDAAGLSYAESHSSVDVSSVGGSTTINTPDSYTIEVDGIKYELKTHPDGHQSAIRYNKNGNIDKTFLGDNQWNRQLVKQVIKEILP